MANQPAIKRRTLLKALVGIPVLGVFAIELFRKYTFDQEKKNRVLKELGLENLKAPVTMKSSSSKTDLLRIGLIGYGSRAVSHANGLGYMLPETYKTMQKDDTLKDWIAQEDLNVAITGICDVFDLHAETGLATARSEYRAGGAAPSKLPVKTVLYIPGNA